MSLEGIESRLSRTVGIDPRATGRTGLEAAVRRRMRIRGATTPDAYAVLLAEDAEEVRRLAAEAAVHETWFFRCRAAFRLLVDHARDRLGGTPSAIPYRVLSLGCSTGEEPASVVLAFHDAGLPVSRLVVDAVDVSERAIAYAKVGRYTARALHETPPSVREAWFRRDGDGYRLDPEIVGHPRYLLANVLDPEYRPESGYDAVFCRNLLIYFVAEARRILLDRVAGALGAGGLLLLGHAEFPLARDLGLVAAGPPEAFAARRGPTAGRGFGGAQGSARPLAPASSPSQGVGPPSGAAIPGPRPSGERFPSGRRPEAPSGRSGADLSRATALADAGRTQDARRLVEALLGAGERSAPLFHLLATLEGAEGDAGAAEAALGKALYLEPDHVPSLVQLALLVDARGDPAYARRLRERARRAETLGSGTPDRRAPEEAEHGDR